MAIDLSKQLDELLDKVKLMDANQIPNIGLYMDQVTTYMEEYLGGLKRDPEDKILTKTMINNYAKNDLLPSPEKKKYSKNHILLLHFIYYFKNVLSISDITTLMKGITESHFQQDCEVSLEKIYTDIINLQVDIPEMIKADLKEKTEIANTLFQDAEDSEYLQMFTLICFLVFDVYMKKHLIENVIDEMKLLTEGKEDQKKK